MPPEVALEYLTMRYARINSAMIRSAREARETHWVSEQQPKHPAHKLASRYQRMPIDRVIRAIQRGERRLRHLKQQALKISIDLLREDFVRRVVIPLMDCTQAAKAELANRLTKIALREQPKQHIDPRIRRIEAFKQVYGSN